MDLVVKTNKLNSAVQNLTLLEVRIIQLAIIDARESGNGLSADKPLVIHAKRYAEAFNVQTKNAYAKIKEAEETLFNRRFSYIDNDGQIVKSRWLQQVKYLDEQGAIELIFTTAVVKGISRIDGAVEFFTKYLLSNTINFKSVYSVRLYELMAQWKSAKNTPIFQLEQFRQQLGILDNDEYSRMYDFKKRVLDVAVNEINEHSNLKINYEQHKKGRVIYGFSFTIKEKDKKKSLDYAKEHTLDMFTNMTDKQRYHFANKLSQLHELSHLAVGQAKMSYPAFAEQIANELKTKQGIEKYKDYLSKVGFV